MLKDGPLEAGFYDGKAFVGEGLEMAAVTGMVIQPANNLGSALLPVFHDEGPVNDVTLPGVVGVVGLERKIGPLLDSVLSRPAHSPQVTIQSGTSYLPSRIGYFQKSYKQINAPAGIFF